MRPAAPVELPPEQTALLSQARRLEILTVVFLLCAATLLYFTMGASQAMRTGFFDDLISTFPALVFLVASRVALRRPSPKFPYGFHKATSVAFLAASLALAIVGLLLLKESVGKVVGGERTTIGAMELFGHTVWAGWPMIAAAIVTSIPVVFLGRAKLKLAPKLHDKVLYADADMMKADWMVGFGTAVAILGVGFGFWWMDPLVAALISLDIIKDGATNTRVAVADLMERRPKKTDRSGPEPVPDQLREAVCALPWVSDARVRVREAGHVFFGEVFILPESDTDDLPRRLQEVEDLALGMDWRLNDITVTALPSLEAVTGEDRADA